MRAPNGNYRVNGSTGTDIFDDNAFPFGPTLLETLSYGLEYVSNGGNDRVTGTKYDDDFFLNSGAEVIDGRGGQDTVVYRDSTAAVDVDLNRQVQVGGWAAGDRLASIENVTGSLNHGDRIVGSNGANVIKGLGGDDQIWGLGGSDTLYGGDGIDFLSGGDGHDTLSGGAQDDTLAGGRGNDTMNGGANNDHFIGTLSGTDVVTGGSGEDTFIFAVGDEDFHLTVTDWNPLIWQGQQPTEAQSQASGYEFFMLVFYASSGALTQAQADAAISTDFVGNDLVFSIHTANVDGTIVMAGVVDLLDDAHSLTLWTDVKN